MPKKKSRKDNTYGIELWDDKIMFNALYGEVMGEPFKAWGMGGNNPPPIIAGCLGEPPFESIAYLRILTYKSLKDNKRKYCLFEGKSCVLRSI